MLEYVDTLSCIATLHTSALNACPALQATNCGHAHGAEFSGAVEAMYPHGFLPGHLVAALLLYERLTLACAGRLGW